MKFKWNGWKKTQGEEKGRKGILLGALALLVVPFAASFSVVWGRVSPNR